MHFSCLLPAKCVLIINGQWEAALPAKSAHAVAVDADLPVHAQR